MRINSDGILRAEHEVTLEVYAGSTTFAELWQAHPEDKPVRLDSIGISGLYIITNTAVDRDCIEALFTLKQFNF